ncbi:uncharacterized protein LOC126971676 [Leptidea sinapis]|uniref:uncharacterized protein LOC126971676 n=1 Tax=Leptidea sinapis TaxID=189913 RepID=UPI0021C2B6B4|nr:uncharacterized protein LOC126971676 [Leptidea sinapis]
MISQITSCYKHLDLSRCITAYGLWKAQSALEFEANRPFQWRRFVNNTQEDMFSRLCLETEMLLRRRSLTMNLSDYQLKLKSTGDGKFNLDLSKANNQQQASGRSSMKQLDKMIENFFPLIILPGLIMSAILPFFLPGLKMMTLAAGMLNNMALTGAVFTLLRNNAFNDKSRRKIIYINNGYGDYDHFPEGSVNDPISINFDSKVNTVNTKNKDHRLIEIENTGISYPAIEDWLKDNSGNKGKVKNVQIMGEVSNGMDWRSAWNLMHG